MARIRSVKPEYWSDATIATFDYFTRLFYIALWNFADDEGRGRALARELAGFAFPLDEDLPNSEIERAILLLEQSGRITLYLVSGVRHFQINRWKEHQVINKPSKSRYPAPHDDRSSPEPVSQNSGSAPVAIPEVSGKNEGWNLESGSGNLESGSGSVGDASPATHEKPTDPDNDPRIGEVIREAETLMNLVGKINGFAAAAMRRSVITMLEVGEPCEILECLKIRLREKRPRGKPYRFEFLEREFPYLLGQIRGSPAGRNALETQMDEVGEAYDALFEQERSKQKP